MLNFILRRLAQIPLVMLVLSVLVIGMTQLLSPEDRAAPYAQNERQADRIEQIIKQRGLDQPFATQYRRWFTAAIHGDLGYSKTSQLSVVDTIKDRMPNTVELTFFAALPIILLSVWLGTLSALHKDDWRDQTVRVLVVFGYSLPTFVLGIVLLAVFYGYLGWMPGPGQADTSNTFALMALKRITGFKILDAALQGQWTLVGDILRHLILPTLTLTIVLSANILKAMRNNMLEVLSSDYVRTARAKGLTERTVNLKHARRNALLPIVTLGGFLIIGLLGGSLITETIFNYPGIGLWFIDSAKTFDLGGVLGFTLLTALIVVVMSTVVDILYGLIDPRVRFE
ncbi:ABC transporter permease [Deinococcus sp.]|uniref:ABC transporter permease n=1 Tax=Deinococcus sp. TaxID=47478 RepID=UPI0025C6652A|nr:ABC transporter permease [Deinococcus sp.]